MPHRPIFKRGNEGSHHTRADKVQLATPFGREMEVVKITHLAESCIAELLQEKLLRVGLGEAAHCHRARTLQCSSWELRLHRLLLESMLTDPPRQVLILPPSVRQAGWRRHSLGGGQARQVELGGVSGFIAGADGGAGGRHVVLVNLSSVFVLLASRGFVKTFRGIPRRVDFDGVRHLAPRTMCFIEVWSKLHLGSPLRTHGIRHLAASEEAVRELHQVRDLDGVRELAAPAAVGGRACLCLRETGVQVSQVASQAAQRGHAGCTSGASWAR
mmetsp:Transcript_130615/g.325928  ORF Transcript_130615/g.325928 Transcript_130615/m.325928 type:complete len:272 (-) Transcript_130615:81-896(-)